MNGGKNSQVQADSSYGILGTVATTDMHMREKVVPDKCCSRTLGHLCSWLLCCCVPVLRVPSPFFCRRALVLVAESHLIPLLHVSRVAGATGTIRKRIPVPCKGLHTQMKEPAPVPA